MDSASTKYPHRDAQLVQHLKALFGDLDPTVISLLKEQLRWVDLAAGEVLMEQGAAGDSAYLAISGRLRVYVAGDDGTPKMVRELGRGEVIGEMSLYTGEPRSATVVAIRDSVLVALDKPHFDALLARVPQVSVAFTRQIIGRLRTEHLRRPVPAPVTVGLLAVSAGVALPDFARRLAEHMARFGRVCVVDSTTIGQALAAQSSAATGEANAGRRLALAIDAFEADHDFVLLLADADASDWTRCCVQHADELLLVADATTTPVVHPIEQACLTERPARAEAAEILVLLHPAELKCPRNVRQWLARRPVTGHVNLRPALERDMARLARLVARKAIGLVLAGGGARGFAHLGIWRALRARGIEIDYVGGTSFGALMAALIAADPDLDQAIEIARDAFRVNPTGDFNVLPIISLIKGRRVRAAIDRSFRQLLGDLVDIEDLWKGFYCIATNYSQARMQPIDSGKLAPALLASIAIPGALPPVVRDGDLLCDGGTFNNFPVDVMRGIRGVGTVIGVDLGVRNPRRLDFDEVPGSWSLLIDRLLRRRRRFRLPSLTSYLLNMTILYSISRQQEARRLTDLYFNPPLYKVGLLDWTRFEQIVRQGEQHATEVLGALSDQQRTALGLQS